MAYSLNVVGTKFSVTTTFERVVVVQKKPQKSQTTTTKTSIPLTPYAKNLTVLGLKVVVQKSQKPRTTSTLLPKDILTHEQALKNFGWSPGHSATECFQRV